VGNPPYAGLTHTRTATSLVSQSGSKQQTTVLMGKQISAPISSDELTIYFV
jgi:hypothetical protein